MSNKSRIHALQGFIRIEEETLEGMKKQHHLLSKAIPELEAEIKKDKSKVRVLEAEDGS